METLKETKVKTLPKKTNEESVSITLDDIMNMMEKDISIPVEEFPNIDLYMDQLTTFMNKNLESAKRNDNDKILTKTMINNYAKCGLLPPPDKKLYTKAHLISLTFIYYLKNILSINDIKKVLDPLYLNFFNNEEFKMEDVYKEVFSYAPSGLDLMREDVSRQVELSHEMFKDAPKDKKEFLQTFALLCEISYSIYIRKHLLESIIDSLPSIDIKKLEKEAKEKEAKAKKEKAEKEKKKK